jgi:hypothetical protein
LNSGETPEAAGFSRSPALRSENSETEKPAEEPQGAAELAARQGAPPLELGDEAHRVSNVVAAGDAEDVELALWEQAARSSAEAVAFSFDGAL